MVNDFLMIRINITVNLLSSIVIYNKYGKRIKADLKEDQGYMSVYSSHLSSGIYYLMLKNRTNTPIKFIRR